MVRRVMQGHSKCATAVATVTGEVLTAACAANRASSPAGPPHGVAPPGRLLPGAVFPGGLHIVRLCTAMSRVHTLQTLNGDLFALLHA